MTAGQPAGAPVIGISAYSETASWGVWELAATVLPQNYSAQVAAAGGAPVLLPPLPGVERAVARLDGLIISGGPDIEPGQYGAQAGREHHDRAAATGTRPRSRCSARPWPRACRCSASAGGCS